MPSATSTTAAAGDRFSSSRSFTDTRTPGARIRRHEFLREFDVLRLEVWVVLQNLLHRSAPSRHLAHVAHGEPAPRKHGLPAQDVVADHQLLLPPRKLLDARLDIVHHGGEPELQVRTKRDAPGRSWLVQRIRDDPVQ